MIVWPAGASTSAPNTTPAAAPAIRVSSHAYFLTTFFSAVGVKNRRTTNTKKTDDPIASFR
jgi:hypothetical protein